MKHRVLFFSDVAYFKGGAENSLFDLLSNPSVEPILIVPGEGELADAARQRGIPVDLIDMGAVEKVRRPFRLAQGFGVLGDTLRAAKQLNAFAKDRDAAGVHSNGLKAHGIACVARLLGGPRLFAHFRAIPFTWKEKLFWWFVRLVATRLVLVSRPCWHGRVLPANARVIHNGIKPPSEELQPRAFGRPLRMGFVGRLQHTKHVEMAIEWFDAALRQGVEATLTIRGEAQGDEQDYADMLYRLAEDKGLGEACRFEGKVQGSLDRIYSGIDVNLVPSMTPDPLPRSIMEALAIGVPVIGYPAGGIPDMVIDGETGFLSDKEECFVNAVRHLTRDAETYDRMRFNGLRHIQQSFSMSLLHASLAEEYGATLPRPPTDA